MVWIKKYYRTQASLTYAILLFIASATYVLASNLSLTRKIVLLSALAITAALHRDIRDGGMISTFLYSKNITYETRNFLTSLAGFVLVTIILAAGQAFYSPLVIIYFIPIVLSSLRGGLRMSMALIAGVSASLTIYYLINFSLNHVTYSQQFVYLFLLISLSIASGTIANRLRKSAVDLSALYETGKALGSLLDMKAILELTLNIVFMDLSPDAAAIYLIDTKTGQIKAEASRGFKEELAAIERDTDKSLVQATITKGQPILLATYSRRYRLALGKQAMASALCVPLRIGDKALGALLVCKEQPHSFGFENERFLEALAHQAAIAIQNARLYWQTKEWASLDGMTGVYNYRYFTDRLEIEWNRAVRYEKPLSLIMIDVDLFKNVNDTHGHMVGDVVLREIAALLRKYTRETDVVARYGGEEFSIILPETHFKDAYLVAEKLRSAVEESVFHGGEEGLTIEITISLGLSNYPSTSFSRTDLLYQADQALYRAKCKRNTLASSIESSTQLRVELGKKN